jgi:hypothetical protein
MIVLSRIIFKENLGESLALREERPVVRSVAASFFVARPLSLTQLRPLLRRAFAVRTANAPVLSAYHNVGNAAWRNQCVLVRSSAITLHNQFPRPHYPIP